VKNDNRKVIVLGGLRIPFCRSGTHYAEQNELDLLSTTLNGIIDHWHLQGEQLGDVTCGAVLKKTEDWNLTREAVLKSKLDPRTPAFDIQRACGTSLEATIAVANKISNGQIEVGIAGGVDSMSAFPNLPGILEPSTGKHMGEHCEQMAQCWEIPRQDQDQYAFECHQKTAAAYDKGFYKDLIIPYQGVTEDNNFRRNTTLEKLATLKPVFEKSNRATLTAGNSSAFTDGASGVLLCSEAWAQKKNFTSPVTFHDAHVSAIDLTQEGLLMAPAYAVATLLARSKLKLQDIDCFEIHEAFAAQVLCTLKAWESERFCKEKMGLNHSLGSIDPHKINLSGGSVAIGHPFAATGTRMVGTLTKHMIQNKSQWGLLSACTGGGMGVTALLKYDLE
jgi:acetyl-CoA C-acetyltransferase